MGIGTSDPTTKLDVNGNFRLRGNSPIAGAVLRSTDNLGNASWMRPAAFRVAGLIDNATQLINANVWTKVMFLSTAEYNEGLHYQPLSSSFVVPVAGVYHFDVQLKKDLAVEHYLRIEAKRGNTYIELARTYTTEKLLTIATDAKLQAGDEIFVSFLSVSFAVSLLSPTEEVWFNGHLVTSL
jgi:hypothetical protein